MPNETNMIAACPKCRARYRIEAGRLKPEGVRLRCSQCDAVFRVTPPAVAPAAVASAPAEAAVQERASVPVAAPPPSAPSSENEPPRNAGPVVVIADSEIDSGKQTAQTLTDWGYAPVLVHDGVEAILTIQRLMPQAVVLDAALTKMFGFQVCELMKRNESLSSIRVVLVGAIHHETRYRREPNEIYGADAYLERPQLPEALRAVLRGFGVGSDAPGPTAGESPGASRKPSSVAPVVTEPTAAPSVLETPAPPAAAEEIVPPAAEPVVTSAAPEAAPPARRASDTQAAPDAAKEGDEQKAARRLARIIVSDIVLYNAEKFDAGVRGGDVVDQLAAELTEGRGLLAQRVAARLRDECDFVVEELVRVARARGMSG